MRPNEAMRRFSLRFAEEVDPDLEQVEGDDGGEGGEGDEGDVEVLPGVPQTAIPDYLKGQSPDQIRAALDRAYARPKGREEDPEIRQLRQDLDELRRNQPAKEPEKEEPLDELLYKDPEAAIDRVIRKRYGTQLADLDSRVGDSVLSAVRRDLPDFDGFEDDVKDLLSRSGAPMSRENILGAYKMVLGERTMADRKQKTVTARNPERTKPVKDKPAPTKLTPLQQEMARASGLSDEDFVKWSNDDAFDISVPTK